MTEILLLFQIQALLEVQPLILVHRILQEICIQIYRTVEEFMIIGTGINFFEKKNKKCEFSYFSNNFLLQDFLESYLPV